MVIFPHVTTWKLGMKINKHLEILEKVGDGKNDGHFTSGSSLTFYHSTRHITIIPMSKLSFKYKMKKEYNTSSVPGESEQGRYWEKVKWILHAPPYYHLTSYTITTKLFLGYKIEDRKRSSRRERSLITPWRPLPPPRSVWLRSARRHIATTEGRPPVVFAAFSAAQVNGSTFFLIRCWDVMWCMAWPASGVLWSAWSVGQGWSLYFVVMILPSAVRGLLGTKGCVWRITPVPSPPVRCSQVTQTTPGQRIIMGHSPCVYPESVVPGYLGDNFNLSIFSPSLSCSLNYLRA